jgi:hypothetical protein
LALFTNEICPTFKPTMQAVIDPHPTRHDLALQNFTTVGRLRQALFGQHDLLPAKPLNGP